MQPPVDENCSDLETSGIGKGLATDIAPPIGRTSRRTCWSVVLSSLLALVLMVTMITRGGMAVAATIPPGLFLNQSVGSLYIQGFAQQLALSDNSVFTVTRINLLVASQVSATIKVDVPGFGPIVIRAFIAKLVIHGLYTKLVAPGVAPPSLVNIDVAFESATMQGLSITITRG